MISPQGYIRFTAILASIAHVVSDAAPSPETIAVCSALYTKYPNLVVLDPKGSFGLGASPNESLYNTANTQYWNAKSSENRAACAFFPSKADEVSSAVAILNQNPSVRFALKCGGHNPNMGFSSVDRGVLIAFRPNAQYAIPSPDGSTITVGAGAKWEDAYAALQPLGKAVVGGRLGDIGVTGFTIGGGLSYLSAQYGLASDNVVDFEVVLANGTVTNANATCNPDLYFALRGGGNQFAIVTRLTLKTYSIGDAGMIWGGVRIYSGDQHSAILAAVANFTTNNGDPKAALIPVFHFAGAGVNVPAAMVFFFYDGPREPTNGVFDALSAIPHLWSETKSRTYVDLTSHSIAGDGQIEILRFQIRTGTFPNMPVDKQSEFLDKAWDIILNHTTASASQDPINFRLFSMAVQPLPRLITAASAASNGGSALGLTPESGDRVWIEYDLGWASPFCDGNCPGFPEEVANKVQEMHVADYSGVYPSKYQSGDLGYISYNPIFMNDAMYDQKVLESYGQGNYQRLKETQKRYDPNGFFATRQDGFKFTT